MSSTETIVCRSTPWYHKRRIAMLVLVFGFCGYFIYDWQIGYPRKREAVAEWLKLKDQLGEKEADAAYAKLAAERGWPAEVDKKHDLGHWDWQINFEQPASAAVSGVIGLIMLYFYVRTTRGRLTADAASFSTPDGQHVPFASAFRIDRRKWDHKGLAYVYYKDPAGKERRAVIDDLIFGGAAKVLERLQANFQGEIVDLAKEPVAEEKKDEPETYEDKSETDAVENAPAAVAEEKNQV
jgi:hypothetical protein